MCHSASFFNHSISSPILSGPAIVFVSSGIDLMFMNVLQFFWERPHTFGLLRIQFDLHTVTCSRCDYELQLTIIAIDLF